MNKSKVFLICPVRGIDQEKYKHLVEQLEDMYELYYPPRDTDQDDLTGYQICINNLEAIRNADIVFFVWDGKSQGCLFDLGMCFALNKLVIPLNMPEQTKEKSFQNMVKEWNERRIG